MRHTHVLPRLHILPRLNFHQLHRHLSTSTTPAPPPLDARWLDTTRRRIGKCLTFGLREHSQLDRASAMLHELARDWRELVAGAEGYLTSRERRGLYRQAVVWGEMVRVV